MWPIIFAAMRTYLPYVTFPVAVVIGCVGYNLEWLVRGDRQQPYEERGILERRDERLLQELTARGGDATQVDSLHDLKEFRPRAVLERQKASQFKT
uniref:small integral membrane protein 12 n=1 Tax=Myxine glutinosa TaxID=7769 RepID=UPI00358FD602